MIGHLHERGERRRGKTRLGPWSRRASGGALAVALAASLLGCATTEKAAPAGLAAAAAPSGRVVGMRRLTESQYRQTIADIFGRDIKVAGRFEKVARSDRGLIATGTSDSAISPAGFEQYDLMARSIALQVTDKRHRATFVPCAPADARLPAPACAGAFYSEVGRYLVRRPLSPGEVDFYVRTAGAATATTGDFYAGLSLGLAAILVSPEFLYRVERATADGQTLDGYSKASRLSFLMWNTGPDKDLLSAASRGDLDAAKGLRAQADRLLASPRLEQGARAFFTDFLNLDRAYELTKDPVVYGAFNPQVAEDLPEQALRTVVDHLIVRDAPYPEIFTTRQTFMNRRLGVIYDVPVAQTGWQPYALPANDDRAGLLGLGAFLALNSHEGRSSPTLRGRAIREVLMCQPVPDPPANVDFSGFNGASTAERRTARQRLTQHVSNPVCAACHKVTDPLGLPLENFDGIGAYRSAENGAAIDAHGSFENKDFTGAAGLGQLLSQSPAPSRCLTQRVAEYAVGRTRTRLPKGWVDALFKDFQAGGYRFRVLMQRVALSPEFYAPPTSELPAAKVAELRPAGAKAKEVQ